MSPGKALLRREDSEASKGGILENQALQSSLWAVCRPEPPVMTLLSQTDSRTRGLSWEGQEEAEATECPCLGTVISLTPQSPWVVSYCCSHFQMGKERSGWGGSSIVSAWSNSVGPPQSPVSFMSLCERDSSSNPPNPPQLLRGSPGSPRTLPPLLQSGGLGQDHPCS